MGNDPKVWSRDESFREYPEPKPPARRGRPVTSTPSDKADPTRTPHTPAVVMPGSVESIQEEVAQISPEGRPADVKSGPGAIMLTLAGLFSLLLIVSIVMGTLVNWATAAAVFGVGCLALLLNPVVMAALMRARERDVVAERHLPPEERRHHHQDRQG